MSLFKSRGDYFLWRRRGTDPVAIYPALAEAKREAGKLARQDGARTPFLVWRRVELASGFAYESDGDFIITCMPSGTP